MAGERQQGDGVLRLVLEGQQLGEGVEGGGRTNRRLLRPEALWRQVGVGGVLVGLGDAAPEAVRLLLWRVEGHGGVDRLVVGDLGKQLVERLGGGGCN